MAVSFKSETQERLFRSVVSELGRIGYSGELLEESYVFGDWFFPDIPERTIAAAAFGQTPVSYDTACFGVALTNGISGTSLVGRCRALGAPILLEVDDDKIIQWTVGIDDKTTVARDRFGLTDVAERFARHKDLWSPQKLLRAKTSASERWQYQQSLFAGLIPELENKIQEILGPMLRSAVATARTTYRKTAQHDADERELFKLVFWMLTAKVFHDRRHPNFVDLSPGDGPAALLRSVSEHSGEQPGPLLDEAAQAAVFDRIWSKMDFRNLSVEVLSNIWSRTLVTNEERSQLGIHRTPRSIVRYIVERLPFESIAENDRIVVEPCCGSAAFLLGALGRLRDTFDKPRGPAARHDFFRDHLFGFEKDSFGVEISKLCLTLSDYPNPDGWHVREADVFTSDQLPRSLRQARVVLCNPPFELFSDTERRELHTESVQKPAELLRIVLDNLHPSGMLGFVLPRAFVDGQGYRSIRRRLVERFSRIELVTLPDRPWEHAGRDTVLLLATEPNQSSKSAKVVHRKVKENGWADFNLFHRVSVEDAERKDANAAEASLAVPDLLSIWKYLKGLGVLGDIAEIHRGIEWNKQLRLKGEETGWREKLVRDEEYPESRIGVPPRAQLFSFQVPRTKYLDMSETHRRGNAHHLQWDADKVIMNSVRKSRRAWRTAAFVDKHGLVCYQNCTALWPHKQADLGIIAAIANSPLGNAYLASREGNIHLTISDIAKIPIPEIDDALRRRVNRLIKSYANTVQRHADAPLKPKSLPKAERILKLIDAAVLEAYGLPPRLERELLDYFRGEQRKVPYRFSDYFPPEHESFFSLSEYLSPKFAEGTAGRFLERYQVDPPKNAMRGDRG